MHRRSLRQALHGETGLNEPCTENTARPAIHRRPPTGQAEPTPLPLRWLRLTRLGLHLGWGALTIACAYPFLREAPRLWLKRRWSRQLLEILGIHLSRQSREALRDRPAGQLFVANHISWLDIFVLNAARPMAFVAKSEVRSWPLAGWLAARTGTLFLQRGRRGHTQAVNVRIAALLAAGRDVAVFPEGTTSDGSTVLSFFGALLQPAIDLRHPVQPVGIAYVDADDRPSTAAAYAGETSFGDSLAAVLACRALHARLRPTPPLTPERWPAGVERRALASVARSAIVYALGMGATVAPARQAKSARWQGFSAGEDAISFGDFTKEVHGELAFSLPQPEVAGRASARHGAGQHPDR